MAFLQLIRRRRIVLKLLFLIPAVYLVFLIIQSHSQPDEHADLQLRFNRPKDTPVKGNHIIKVAKNHHVADELEAGDSKLKFERQVNERKAENDASNQDRSNELILVNEETDSRHEQERKFAGNERRQSVLQEDRSAVVAEKNVEGISVEKESEIFSQHKIRDEHEDPGQIPQVPQLDTDKAAPGELGSAVVVDRDKLSPVEQEKYDAGWKNNAYNQYVADMISLHRTLPDVRDPQCKKLTYPINELPDTSVIICFHNEAWSVLLRTVHSVLDRSPPHLVKEIILVDDFSNMDHLKKPLEDYLANLVKVKVIRLNKREGLIRARLMGAKNAVGKVLTFLDSHCECAEGWLEPLLVRIHRNFRTVTCPVIDVIDEKTFKFLYSGARQTNIGGFDWGLQFSWHTISEPVASRRKSDIDPLRLAPCF